MIIAPRFQTLVCHTVLGTWCNTGHSISQYYAQYSCTILIILGMMPCNCVILGDCRNDHQSLRSSPVLLSHDVHRKKEQAREYLMSFEELKSNVPFQKSFRNTFQRKPQIINDWITKGLSQVSLLVPQSSLGKLLCAKTDTPPETV